MELLVLMYLLQSTNVLNMAKLLTIHVKNVNQDTILMDLYALLDRKMLLVMVVDMEDMKQLMHVLPILDVKD